MTRCRMHDEHTLLQPKRNFTLLKLSAESLLLQDLDIAIIKATTSQFHVVPKEKHVKSKHTDLLLLLH